MKNVDKSVSMEAEIAPLVDKELFPTAIKSREEHDRLLEYLQSRLALDAGGRTRRRDRFEKADKALSTWQKLSKEDQLRERISQSTGEATPTTFNLPVMHAYIEDMVSFYTEVFAPQDGSFFAMPSAVVGDEESLKRLVRKLNADARQGSYYQELSAFARSCLVYNAGGFVHEWVESGEQLGGRNQIKALDMYNFSYDPAITDLGKLPEHGMWAATFHSESLVSLYKKEAQEIYQGIARAFRSTDSRPEDLGYKGNVQQSYYKRPPAFVTQESSAGSNPSGVQGYIDAMGIVGHTGDHELEHYDVVEMYCWVNPKRYGLAKQDSFELWRFTILNGLHIIRAEKHYDEIIPCFCTTLHKHTLHSEQKSAAEYIQPFQRFISFLANIYVKGMRKNTFGRTFYDPAMYNLKEVETGEVSAQIQSKIPGRDVRQGVYEAGTQVDVSGILPAMQQMMQFIGVLFPTQALPSQVAGIDRAVKNQVAAVLQGANKRLHASIRALDSAVMGPMYLQSYRNLVRFGKESFPGVDDEDVYTLIGTGLMQLNKDSNEEAMRQLLFALIQNPQSAESLDVVALMQHWAMMMGLDIDIASAAKGQPPQNEQGTPEQPQAPEALDVTPGV